MGDRPDELRDLLAVVLRAAPGLTARELARRPELQGIGTDKHLINSCLHASGAYFQKDEASPPRWVAVATPALMRPTVPSIEPSRSPQTGHWAASLNLYPWQRRALDGWADAGHRGVIEAVTGAGKTRLALAGIEAELRRGGRAVAIVPTKDLQRQWLTEIQHQLVEGSSVQARVGGLGNGYRDTLATVHVLVATVQSASAYNLGLAQAAGLLVADEAHHYGAEVWSAALEAGFDRRLGLTATYERDDGGVEAVLDPYFGVYRYTLGYAEALADDVIAHFKIAFVGVRFGPYEANEYEEADSKARRRRGELIRLYGLPEEPFGKFMRAVQRLAKSNLEGSRQAGLYLSAFSKRRQVLARAEGKFACLRELAPAIEAADSTIVFAQTVEAAERAVDVIEETGIPGDSLHAELDPSERQETFDAFRDGVTRFIAAPKLLDEGVDVPDADLAIVLGTSRSRRQMIQRMGRVIRRKDDGRLARLVVLFVEDTSEDPDQGAHEDFLDFVVDAADDMQVFRSGTDPVLVNRYLNDWRRT